MSKYTTELRYICERKAGLSASVSLSGIDQVIEQSWDKIFTTKVSFFDEAYRKPLCKKIIKHYWFREIGMETAALFLYHLNMTMEEIMPYYNQMYKSELLEFNPLYDVDYRTTGKSDTEGNDTQNDTRTTDFTRSDNLTQEEVRDLTDIRTDNLTNTRDLTNINMFHDTPQGNIGTVEDSSYLTDLRKITDDGTIKDTGTVTNDNTGSVTVTNSGTQKNGGTDQLEGNRNFKNTNEYNESVQGKSGGASYAKLLMEFRESMINIDQMVIDEFATCFMGLY